jgi:RNA polymerase sigma factor (sigma-70 family)
MTVRTGQHTLAEQVSATIQRHREGDPGALGELFSVVRPWLQHIAFACRISRYSVDDVVQSTMESAIINLPRLRDPDAGLAWLSVIARREAVRVSREERRTDLMGEHEDFADTADTADPERLVLAHIARDALLRALAKLPERHRALLTLLFLDDRLDYVTIASELDMPVGSIGPTRQRGLKKVRALLTEEEDQGYARCA